MARRVKWFNTDRGQGVEVDIETKDDTFQREWHDFLQQRHLLGVYSVINGWGRATFTFSREDTAALFKMRFS